MKFPINTVIKINDCDWKVEEYRLGRGREWVYTLSTDLTPLRSSKACSRHQKHPPAKTACCELACKG